MNRKRRDFRSFMSTEYLCPGGAVPRAFLAKVALWIFLSFMFAVSSGGQTANGNALAGQNLGGAKLLEPSKAAKTITLKEAFSEALANHSKLLLANNQLQRRRAENLMRISAILPKLRLGSVYTRNIPEVEMALPDAGGNASLNRQVASLLRKSGDNTSAEELEHQADLMSRRRSDGKILLNPKHVFDAKLTLEVPLFNGPDIARLLTSGDIVLLQEARVREEEANTIFMTAKAYFFALHLRNVLVLREQAETAAEERYLKAQAEKKRGVIIERDYLLAYANFLQRQAERQGALIEYRGAIGELGILLGRNEEFAVLDPDQLMFEPLNGDTEKLIEVAMNNRADLKAERQALRVSENERFGNFLQFLPSFSLQGDAKYTSNEKSLIGKAFTYAISLNAHLSLFEGGMSIGLLRGTALKRQESEIRLRNLRLEIDAKVRGRKEKLFQLTLNEQASNARAQAEQESEHVAFSRHKRGLIDLQELLETSDRKLNAEIAFKKAQSDLNEEKLALIFEAGLLTPQFVQ